jgi:hypothetical protein
LRGARGSDVASRGIDINDVTHVFNYDFPRDMEEYVHRSIFVLSFRSVKTKIQSNKKNWVKNQTFCIVMKKFLGTNEKLWLDIEYI